MKLLFSVLSAIALLLPLQPQAQTTTNVLFVPYPAGGILDTLARILSQKLQEQTKETFIVENRPGANGMIGAKVAARAKADGRTLIVADGAVITVNPFMYPADATFSPDRDLRVVRSLGQQLTLLVVHPAFPAKTLKEFADHARKTEVNYASGGIGTSSHLSMALFGSLAGDLKLNHVAYKGGPPALNDLVGGQIGAGFIALPNALPFVRRDQLRALAMSGAARSPHLPNVPTMIESGFPGFVVENTYFVMLPADTPPATVRRVDALLVEALADPAVQERIRATGLEPYARLGEADAKVWITNEREMWQRVIRENRIKAE